MKTVSQKISRAIENLSAKYDLVREHVPAVTISTEENVCYPMVRGRNFTVNGIRRSYSDYTRVDDVIDLLTEIDRFLKTTLSQSQSQHEHLDAAIINFFENWTAKS